jgi:hypothetical protein
MTPLPASPVEHGDHAACVGDRAGLAQRLGDREITLSIGK